MADMKFFKRVWISKLYHHLLIFQSIRTTRVRTFLFYIVYGPFQMLFGEEEINKPRRSYFDFRYNQTKLIPLDTSDTFGTFDTFLKFLFYFISYIQWFFMKYRSKSQCHIRIVIPLLRFFLDRNLNIDRFPWLAGAFGGGGFRQLSNNL